MKPGTQIMLAGVALVLLAAFSSSRRSKPLTGASQSPGACCPWVAGLDGFCQRPGTNGPLPNQDTGIGTRTNQP